MGTINKSLEQRDESSVLIKNNVQGSKNGGGICVLLISTCFLLSCQTGSVTNSEEIGARTSRTMVIERADGLQSSPDWASLTKSNYEEAGKMYFLGYIEVDGDSLKSAALNMSDEKALSEPMKSIVQEFLDQNQVGEDLMQSTGQRIISATRGSRIPLPGMYISKRYWESIETLSSKNESGVNSRLRAYSLGEVSVTEYQRAKQKYLERLEGNTEVQNILKEVGAKQRDRLLSSQ